MKIFTIYKAFCSTECVTLVLETGVVMANRGG